MNKQEFLATLRKRLSGLPKEDIEERLSFYEEMIADRMEDGRTEEEAVADIGDADEVSVQIIREIPLAKIVKQRIKPKRRLKAWEIVLLALGSPIWLSLAIAAAAVILSLYVVLWSVLFSLWCGFIGLAVCGLISVPDAILIIAGGNAACGFVTLAVGMICAGLSVLTFYGSKAATKRIVTLTKKIAVFIKKCLIRKEEEQ